MVRSELLRRRLQKLDEYLAILEKLKRYSREQFLEDPERYGSAERFLQLAIEAISDMASHVIAESALGVVTVSSDLPRLFHENGYLDEDLANKWIRIIGFRNILVHDYLEIDRSIVYQVLQKNLPDLATFKRVFAQFL